MTDRATIDALTKKVMGAASAAIAEAVAEVISEAYRAGEAAARERVLAAIGGEVSALPSEPRPAVFVSTTTKEPDETFRRAPKGLTKEVVTLILGQHPQGLPLEEVQQMAVEFDNRLSQKTVYNELMRGRRSEYRHTFGIWHLATGLSDLKATDQIEATEEVMRTIS